MKDIERPAKRIFSQNKEADKFVKTHKSSVEKTLTLIAANNSQKSVCKKRKFADIDERKERNKKDKQNTLVYNSLSQNATKPLKSLSSDKKRLESLKEWQKQLNQQKSTLKKALSMNNTEDYLNKKVIFEESETDISTKIGKRKPLFDESSLEDSDNEEKLNERFRYKIEFEGKSGKKLKKLQKKYGSDHRFKLSENFLDNEDMDNNIEKLVHNNDQGGIKDEEIENTLKIADEILQNTDVRIKSSTNKIFKDMSALRFDPDKIQHKKLGQTPNKISKKKFVTAETTRKNEKIPALPKVKNSLYYEVETSLKEAFTNSTDQPFSLLASFANVDAAIEDEIYSEEVEEEMVLETKPSLEDNEISSCEEFENRNESCTKAGTDPVEAVIEYPDKNLFFLLDDKRLKEGVTLFHRTIEEDEMWKQWKAQEKKIKLLFQTRQKHIVRRLNYKKSAAFSKKK